MFRFDHSLFFSPAVFRADQTADWAYRTTCFSAEVDLHRSQSPPEGDAHRHRPRFPFWLQLPRRGGHCASGGNEPTRGAQHRRDAPETAGKTGRGGKSFCALGFRARASSELGA